MKITLVAVLGLLMFVAPCMAKDNEYRTGMLTKALLHVGSKKDTGFTDTTDCRPGLVGVNCTGGIVENYDGKLVATMPDGSLVVVRALRCRSNGSSIFPFMFAALGLCDDRRRWDNDVLRACAIGLGRGQIRR